MILACPKHVKEALNMLDLPHIFTISDENIFDQKPRCQICSTIAKYKLYN